MARYQPDPDYDAGQIIDDLGHAVADVYGGVTARLERKLAQKLRAATREYPDLTERLRVMAELEQYATVLFARVNAAGMAERIMAIAAEKGTAAALAEIAPAKVLPPTLSLQRTGVEAALSLQLELTNHLQFAHLRVLSSYPGVYRDAVARLVPDLLLGAATIQEVQQRVIREVLARGVTGFTDSLGRQYRLGTYAERAVRTAAARSWQDASIAQQQRLGLNFVHVFCGRSACDRCAPWAGKILSTDSTPAGTYQLEDVLTGALRSVTVAATLEEARRAGFQHPNDNCACPVYLPGLSKPVGGSQLDRQRYRDEQRQRALERAVRDLKRQKHSAAPSEATRWEAKIRAKQADLRALTNETGLVRRNYREQLKFSDGAPIGA